MNANFALMDLSTTDLIIILAIVILLFGGKKLPDLSRSIGESVRELKKGFSEDKSSKNAESKKNSKKDQA